ncbi:phosphotransferase enzyme family protein [Neobacillus massiliamazoniensis]|uniref:Homoserine kinase type II n=1 Tax=Neobacillus massiliamazoniensis TaxID=1499688 RepID=A0A0U1NXX7_9BACI|nr:phosphotransferase [Neobacillus massiliamazoniensis]CRK82823.1 homoserine kinase type II [Neobacillus massiliamazoniensis]
MSNTSFDPLKESIEKFTRIAGNAVKFYPILSQSTIQLLNYSENATFLVNTTTGEKYILRVGRPLYHSKTEIESELEWLKLINKHSSIKVSLPIVGENGEYVQEVEDENISHFCALFTFLEGDAPNEENEHDLISQFEVLGDITAQLHEYSILNRHQLQQMKRIEWDYTSILGTKPKWGRWQDGLAMTDDRLELFEKVSEKIKQRLALFGKSQSRYGLIHSDLRLANLLVDGQQIKIIDFDDCGFGWYLYDLATSLSFIEHKPYIPTLINAWLKGYRKVRSLSQEEELEIPTFILMRRLQLIAWVGSRHNETTRELGSAFTEETDELAKKYLEKMEI